jgi:hypothetical protein
VGRWGRGERRGGAGGAATGDVKLGGAGARAARRAARRATGGGAACGAAVIGQPRRTALVAVRAQERNDGSGRKEKAARRLSPTSAPRFVAPS